MKILSWNVNGIRSVYKKGFLEWLREENPDTLCLQEIKSSEIPAVDDLFTKHLESNYFTYLNPAKRKGYSGVAIYSKDKPRAVIKTIGVERFDEEGRFMELRFPKFTIINLYIPHGARDKRNLDYKLNVYNFLSEYIKSKLTESLIICGDFNVAHKEIDLARPKANINNIMFTAEERESLDNLVDSGFTDSFRELNKKPGNYSWWPYRNGLREKNIGWRIDYIFLSNILRRYIKSVGILKEVRGSDHCPISLEINM